MMLDARFVNHTTKPSLTVMWRIVSNAEVILEPFGGSSRSTNGLLGSWLDWHREVGQFQDQMRGKMHGCMVVFGINPTELS